VLEARLDNGAVVTSIRLRRPIRFEDGQGPPRYPVKEALAILRHRLYSGDRKLCPCCGRTSRLFLFTHYMTALCPYCLSTERYRQLCRYLRDETDFGSKETRLLDIAPMWCFQEFCRSFPTIEYVSIDIASPMAMRLMDIRDLEFRDGLFDCLICYHVLEHIDDDDRALSELFRVLKPGGWAIIQVPTLTENTVERKDMTDAEVEEVLKFDDHRRSYGWRDFPEFLRSAGFDVEVVPFGRSFSEEEIARQGLDFFEDLHVCRKP
jgi:SAM-dependent methyltransferase